MKLRVLHEGQTIVFDLIVGLLGKKYRVVTPQLHTRVPTGPMGDISSALRTNTRFVGIRKDGPGVAIGRIINWPNLGYIVGLYHTPFSPDGVQETWDSTDPNIADKVFEFFEKAEEEAAPIPTIV